MGIYRFSVPQEIIVGYGALFELTKAARALHKKHALIVSGPHLKKMGLVDRIRDLLLEAGCESDSFTQVEGNPSAETVDRAARAYLESGCDFMVACGGGSPMDVAKAAGVVAKFGGRIMDYEGGENVPGEICPIIAIPTTAGTASEVTQVSVITDHSTKRKFSLHSHFILPSFAILDPSLITTVPASTAAACGMDAFIHAEESYVSLKANPYTQANAEKAMELIGRYLRRYVANRQDYEAAEGMLTGSLMAGLSFSKANLGNVHALSHPVSAFYGVAHGTANAVLLPAVVAYNAPAAGDKYLRIYNALSCSSCCEENFQPQMLQDYILKLNRDLGIPADLRSAIRQVKEYETITEEEILASIPQMAIDAAKSGNVKVNPRATQVSDLEELYRSAL